MINWMLFILNGELSMCKTPQDLKDAFSGESQANRTYLAFQKKLNKKVSL